MGILRLGKRSIIYLLMTCIAVGMVFPFFWMVSTSLKTEADSLQYPPRFIPDPFTFTGYRNLFDPSTGFVRPRMKDGSWMDPFEPLALAGFCEANSWQYSFFVPHDIEGLIEAHGGERTFTERIDALFGKRIIQAQIVRVDYHPHII